MTSSPRARYSAAQLAPITPVPTTAIRRTGLLKDVNLRNPAGSKRYTKTGKKYIRSALVRRHLGSERVPYVLITRNQSDRWSERKIIEDLHSLLVFNGGCARCKLSDAILQIIADRVVV